MATKPKTFDAVEESRKWKEAVAQKTAGMTKEELLAFFDRDRAWARMQEARERLSARVAEDAPPTNPS